MLKINDNVIINNKKFIIQITKLNCSNNFYIEKSNCKNKVFQTYNTSTLNVNYSLYAYNKHKG